MDNQFKQQLDKIESLADQKFKDIEKENYNKYYYIYKIVIDFLKDRSDVLLYGGTAINAILPKKFKIYEEYELPDIDVYTPNSKKLINSIISHYNKNYKDIKLVSSSEALHQNTYKVYAEGLHILDVTEIPKKDFIFLQQNLLKTDIGIPSVGIRFIKFTLHLLSSQSYDSHRWSKVYDRLLKIYKVYPSEKSIIKWDEFYNEDVPSDIYMNLQNWVNSNGLMSFGMDEIERLIKKPKSVKGFPILYLLSKDDATPLLKSLDKDIKVSKKMEGISFIESYYKLTYKNHNIGYIFNTEACYSIITKDDKTHLSANSIISLLYKLYMSSREEESMYIPVIDKLSKIVMKYSYENNIEELYSIECYGSQKSLTTLRREKIMRHKNKNSLFRNTLAFYRLFMI